MLEQRGEVVGFVLAFREGIEHDSVNYRWFAERYPTFLYVDRVVVASESRGAGAGSQLYERLFEHAVETGSTQWPRSSTSIHRTPHRRVSTRSSDSTKSGAKSFPTQEAGLDAGCRTSWRPPESRPSGRSERDPVTLAAVVFDMDGLMFDTERLARDAWRRAMADHGYALSDDLYLTVVGRTVEGACGVFVEALGPALPIADIEAAKTRYLREMLESGAPLKPGLPALLDGLDALGLAMAVASSTARSEVESRLARLGLPGRFRALVGGDEVVHGKPSADLFLLASERLGTTPVQRLVLEDSEAGVWAAASAGMATVMVPDLVQPRRPRSLWRRRWCHRWRKFWK